MSLIDQISRSVRQNALSSKSGEVDGAAIDAALDQFALEGMLGPKESVLKDEVKSQLFGFGPLQVFLDDPLIEEIWINRPNEIYLAREGQVRRVSVDLSTETLRTLILRMLRDTGRRIDSSLPFADAVLPDGSRLHVVIPDVTATNWSVNIRKFPPKILRLRDLVESQTLSPSQADYLSSKFQAGANVLISGATHSGKTTLLGALISELPEETRLVSCEETFELRVSLKDWVPMQARQPNLEGKGEIPLRRLVKEALRMRPELLVVGEVREAEALDLLIAMNSGVTGACTIHANNAQGAITKLCTLPLLAGPNISAEFVLNTVSTAVNLVVHCVHLGNGKRRVTEIAEIATGDDGRPRLTQVNLQ
ncbi:MAG: hypothetical protein RL530_863 [Actinomycetota bacterium]